ncbi:uncharacterized protein EV420DRAFT_1623583 [Desarmillaria tabescens]|uniref:DUF4218 domain-containing protein n=1 Tax=Armillaria tabescens TaxID=1929756 RepID=A0AA39J3Z3_ARMTA|nr:uncharacterized protein EV420DRAFT_1623583 [Desarmillaria tabescens]KAK0435700.1 hypothetical protein EV420DRAFT_1623583 [Desarmillaria tabescens]
MRKQTEAWRDATTCKARETIFKKYGVHWSEFWRLPYWDPTWMLVIDSMHCILEGLVHYHCHYVLAIDKDAAKKLTVFLPLALVTLWRDDNGQEPDADHTMVLFQAIIIMCKYTMTVHHAILYCEFMKKWADRLFEIHPHTKAQNSKPNIHASFHLYDFLLLFEPVYSWWTFPFERLIGMLQKINTNDHVSSEPMTLL